MFLDIDLTNVSKSVESKKNQIESRRESVAGNIVSDEWKFNKIESIASAVQDIAGMEGELQVLTDLERYMEIFHKGEKNFTLEDIYAQLLQSHVMNGADDRWSGRGNDLRRTVFEAKLELLRDLKYALRTKKD